MNQKNVILARPNLFIVNEMKRLMADCSFTPTAIRTVSDLERFDQKSVGGVVISTGLHSPIESTYAEVVKKSQKELPGKPILLASMIDFDHMKRSISLNFEKEGIDFELLSIQDADKKSSIDRSRAFLVIQKSDITDESRYQVTRNVISRFFA